MTTHEIEMTDLQSQQEEVLDPQSSIILNHPSLFKKANPPVTLKLDNVVYKINTKTSKNSKPEERIILKGITGSVLPGEMLAMLGPSGSGKTSLLSALGGRIGGHQLDGNITYNGKPFSSSINRKLGFVAQEDAFYPHLTVTETLVFTALLRLPNTLTKQEKVMQAEGLITQLGLTGCKNSVMGDRFLRGVSGGEKRRVSIGQELLINPSLLLLDEPTSGLDSTSAHRIVSMLLELVRGGQTVVMSIHQPSSKLFYMFHKILLLSYGNPLYFGKGGETMDYFASIGYAPSVPMNPSEFLLDLANGVYLEDSDKEKMNVKKALVSAYKSNLTSRLKEELQETGNDDQGINRNHDKGFNQWTTTWIQQFSILLRRDLKERKHDCFSSLKIFHVSVIAFLVALVWWKSSISHIQDQTGLLFYYCLYWCVQPFYDAISTFPQLRMMLVKERSSSMYRLSSFLMARMMADLPMELIRPTLFVTTTYWAVGLKPTARCFFETLSIVLYGALVSQGLALAMGALCMNLSSAMTLGTVIIQALLLAGGFFVQHVPAIIEWIKYICFTFHTYKLLLGSQYKSDQMYPCGTDGSCRVGNHPTIKSIGLGDRTISIFALGLMFVGCRVVAYIALMKVGGKRS